MVPKVSASSFISPLPIIDLIHRCTSKNHDLDNLDVPRTYELSERLILALDTQDLWDDFGMVKDLVVRVLKGKTATPLIRLV